MTVTTLPEEAVTAALAKWMELPSTGDASSLKRDMRAALTAALPFLPVQVAVKKLEWRKYRNGDAETVTPFGEIYTAYVNGYWRITRNGKAGKFIKATGGDDVEAAKASAQADYSTRILSALEPSAPDIGKPITAPSAAREMALEEAARLVETHAYIVSNAGPRLEPSKTAKDDQHHATIAAAIRALSSPYHADAGKVDGDRWLPIESAPKDGTIVLLGWNDPDINEIGAVAGWYENGPADKCWYDQYHEPVTATHWMPLRPLPPAPASEGGE